MVKQAAAAAAQLSIFLQHFLLVPPQAQTELLARQTLSSRNLYFKALAVLAVAVASTVAQVARVAWVQAVAVVAQVRLPVVTAARVAMA